MTWMNLIEELEKEIDQFIENFFDSEQTLYQALQKDNEMFCFSLHDYMEKDDDITQLVIQKYFKRLEKKRLLEFYDDRD